jgi:hypothetical protein
MSSTTSRRPALQLMLTLPVIVLVLAATAIPVEFRPLGAAPMTLEFGDIPDIVENLVGYLPLGLVLGRLGLLRAVAIAGLIAASAEISQLAMTHRDPSFTDIGANLAGAALGALASARWRIRSPALRTDGWRALLAVPLALALVLHVRSMAGEPVNPRGATSPGTLEAHWKLDEASGRAARDWSGHDLAGEFRKNPHRIAGVTGRAPVFDGANYVDFGRSSALRLAGSMTISAWIRSSAYPEDDAAIVSQLGKDRGYQLDTTIDEGPRTLGFKLTDACGELMARYGGTPLALDTWYHVAGVYDAAAQTLDVYLNGELDNGALLGSVSAAQRSARGPVSVGRRARSPKFNFSGSIEDVRIYSFALTPFQIAADMRGEAVGAPPAVNASVTAAGDPSCGPLSDNEDKDLPFAAALLGALGAVACVGAWPSASRLLALLASLAAGGLLLTVTPPNLPAFVPWMLPVVALVGGASVVVSVRRARSAEELPPA